METKDMCARLFQTFVAAAKCAPFSKRCCTSGGWKHDDVSRSYVSRSDIYLVFFTSILCLYDKQQQFE